MYDSIRYAQRICFSIGPKQIFFHPNSNFYNSNVQQPRAHSSGLGVTTRENFISQEQIVTSKMKL